MVYYRSGSRIIRQRNWVCATNSNFLIPISLQPDSVVFLFQTYIIWYNRIHCLKYLRSTTSGCKDIRIRKLEFVTKTQFLYLYIYRMIVISLTFVISSIPLHSWVNLYLGLQIRTILVNLFFNTLIINKIITFSLFFPMFHSNI